MSEADLSNDQAHRLLVTLKQIAMGRRGNGRPLGGEAARQLARNCLLGIGLDHWRDAYAPPERRGDD